MRANYFKERVYIYREYKEVDEYGESILGKFKEIYSTRGEVILEEEMRSVENNNVLYNNIYRLTVRRYVDVREYDRILWKDKFYRVLSVDERHDHQCKIISMELVVE